MKLEDIKYNEFIGQGKCGKCYKLKNGNVFKEFNTPESISEIDKFKYLLEHKNDSFMFPFDFVYDEVKFYGHISKFALGDKFIYCASKSDLMNMSNKLIKLEEDISNLSKSKVYMFDFHDENLLYDNKKFSVIDVDKYVITKKYSIKELEKLNTDFLKNIVYTDFIDSLALYNRHACDTILKKRCFSKTTSEMVYLIKKALDNYYGEDIKCLDDVKKYGR